MEKLIINIYHESEHTPYAIRAAGSGGLLIGLATIQQVDAWLKSNKGGFTSGPKETEAGWVREASIPVWYYQQLMGQQLEKAA